MQLSPIHRDEKTIVALARCDRYESARLRETLQEVLEPFGGMRAFVRPGMRVLLKPNYVVARRAEAAANTHPLFILAVAELVRECGGEPFVGDSPGWGSARGVAKVSGFLSVAEATGIPVVELSGAVASPLPFGTTKHLKLSRVVCEADLIINLPKFKAHQQMLMTLAVKNCFGCVPGRRKAALHMLSRDNREWFARMLVENYVLVRPQLHLMDGILAMEGNGPSNGKPRPLGVVMAATDAVAMDRVAVELVGLPWHQLTTLVAARDMGVGVTDLEKLELIGPPLDSLRCSTFELPLLMPISFSPYRVLRGLVRNYLIRWAERRREMA
ncbi:hypothetical protein BRCON_1919 [Candidatus Sumerlaea chitinivorans]|uniref:DUF362 domain-containing protein n=1 Tax=Sumerlaea chitinivorans TaxID=2250252 RepID=A0A2Z4Y6S4_SUMC1|nr:hypothetical protein BRCON_1919 [Candidatus Sumerlaea chitinivorans]